MSLLASRSAASLEWTQPHALRTAFELRADGQPIGSLALKSAFGTLATAACGEQHWTFKRVGFWQQKVSVREEGSETDLAEFVNNTWNSGGELRFPDGRAYRATSNFWSTKLEWHGPDDRVVARLEHSGFLKLRSVVTIPPDAPKDAPVDLLVPLGLYLVVMLHRDSAAGAAVSTAG